MSPASTSIENEANKLLHAHNMQEDVMPPVITLATNLGISVQLAAFKDDDVSGLIRKEDDGYAMYINESHPPTRKRFTIAHEIGHFILHKDEIDAQSEVVDRISGGLMRDGQNSDLERQANQFAAALLMPKETFLEMWKKLSPNIDLLAEAFGVSAQAASYRLLNLGAYIP